MKSKSALILVDLQNDFCRGGSLEVVDADAVIPYANALQSKFELVIASKDWHPADHSSFASNHPDAEIGDIIELDSIPQILWPDHCIQGSPGADFHPQLVTDRIHKVVFKGTDKHIDSYSIFFDNAHLRSTGLADYLREQQIKDIYIMGLATDYCVKYSALDAVELGFNTYVIKEGCRGVECLPGDSQRALQDMKKVGVNIIKRI